MSEGPRFLCQTCGRYHEGPPMSYDAAAPDILQEIPEDERARRVQQTPDTYMIDRDLYFILGNIEVPIIDSNDVLSWGVWVAVSEGVYQKFLELLDQPGRAKEPPYLGWVSNRLAVYPDTLNMHATVHNRPLGKRPLVTLDESDHPLAVEQHNGITRSRVQKIAEAIHHPKEG